MSKSRLAPIKQMSIPRLELAAAVMAVQMEKLLRSEIKIPLQESVFHTDSQIVLQYIKNTTLRLQTFVANRVAMIHDGSSPHQWMHIESEENPADIASRGLSAKKLVQCEEWKNGPSFLWEPELQLSLPEVPELSSDDKEVKKTVKSLATDSSEDPVGRLMEKY